MEAACEEDYYFRFNDIKSEIKTEEEELSKTGGFCVPTAHSISFAIKVLFNM